jgi:hypothetical protein
MSILEEADMIFNSERLLTLAIANMKDRSTVDVSRYFGMESSVAEAIKSPTSAMKKLIQETLNAEWNGTDPLWQFIVDTIAKNCETMEQVAVWGVDQRRRDDCHRMIAREMAAPGSVKPHILKSAQDLLGKPEIPKPPEFQPIPMEDL